MTDAWEDDKDWASERRPSYKSLAEYTLECPQRAPVPAAEWPATCPGLLENVGRVLDDVAADMIEPITNMVELFQEQEPWVDENGLPLAGPGSIIDIPPAPAHPEAYATLPMDYAARKAIPMATGLLDYFPDALADVARLSAATNEKHNPGEPMHWSKEKSSDHRDCMIRHTTETGKIDPNDGFLHDTKAAWRALAQLQITIERLRREDIRYP